MPRGNDSQAAIAELTDKVGRGAGDADELIQANAQRWSVELLSAQKRKEDTEASENLDLDSVAKAAGVKEVLAAAVRGDAVVWVAEDDSGRAYKGVTPVSEVGKPKKAPAKAAEKASAKKD